MRSCIFDAYRLGIVLSAESKIADVSELVPEFDPDPMTSHWRKFIRDFDGLESTIAAKLEEAPTVRRNEVALKACVQNPSKIVAVAANYAEHVVEMAPQSRDRSLGKFDVFLKSPSSITDPGSRVVLPNVDEEIHFEGELAFVIGKTAKNVPVAEAMQYVHGFTMLLDVTVRGEGDRSRRKSYDGFTPVGAELVSRDEIPDWRNLHIVLKRNGEVRQDVIAGEMLKGVEDIVAYASSIMTLEPGDLVASGSPAGVGVVERGDEVKLTISEIGVLTVGFS